MDASNISAYPDGDKARARGAGAAGRVCLLPGLGFPARSWLSSQVGQAKKKKKERGIYFLSSSRLTRTLLNLGQACLKSLCSEDNL